MPFGKRRANVFANGIKHPNAREVKVSIIFTRIGEIDTINEKFSCEATLFITWSEKVTEKNQNYQIEGSSNVNSKLFWDPQLYIDNAIGDVKEKDVKYRIGKFYDDIKQEWYLEVHMIKRIQGTFFEKLELYHFPFDVQDLSITLTSHRTLDEIIIVQDYAIPPKMTKSASLDKHIWKLYDHVNIKIHMMKNDLPLSSFDFANEELEIESACSHPAITMQCRVSRKPGYFIINCLLPTLMITLCVFFTFMMDYSRYQYRFSLLFTTMLTSITFRWAIHGRVLPTISYMTFLDVYCVSSIMIVFSAMVWHAFYLVLYKRDRQLADRCDRYAMVSFGIVVVAIHIMQAIWFCIAFKKRLELENLDKKAALTYLKTRMAMNSMHSSSIQKDPTTITSEQKFQNQVLTAAPNTNQKTQATVVIPTTNIQPERSSPTHHQSKQQQQPQHQTIDIDTCARKAALLMSGMKSLSTSSNGSCDGGVVGGIGEHKRASSQSKQPPHQLVIVKKTSTNTNKSRPSTTSQITTTTTLQIKNQQQPQHTHTHLKPGHLERSRNLESTDLEDSLSKLSPHNSDTSLNSLNQKTIATTTTASIYNNSGSGNSNRNHAVNYIEDNSNSNTCDSSRKASESFYAIGGADLNHNNLSYQYIPLIHQSSRDS